MEETNLFGEVEGEEIAGLDTEDDEEELTAGGFEIIEGGGQKRPRIKRKKKER